MKKCRTCGKILSFSNFNKSKCHKGGCTNQCKQCYSIYYKEYAHSIDGFVTKIYKSQKENSLHRNMALPLYTKLELKEWLCSQTSFHELFKAWQDSNFDLWLVPSVDRIDDYVGYTLENIQLMTFKENNKKGHDDAINGVNNKLSKAVCQLTLSGEFIKDFYSSKHAEREILIDHSNIAKCCKGKANSAGGYKWQYKEAV